LKHRFIAAGALVLALSLLLSLQPAFASVDLVYFRAAAQADNTVLVTWQTATERGTVGFRLFRADSAAPGNWGDPITTVAAQGNSVTGADYQYVDSAVTAGAKYYYLLREVTSTSTADYGPVSAGIGVPTDTPTPTATATTATAGNATPTATTRAVVTGGTATPTGRPAPTATRRFTETPFVSPLATPLRTGGATTSPLRTPIGTALPAASLATPTGLAPRVTMPPSAAAATAPEPARAETPTFTPTLEMVATEESALQETATPRPTKEITPVIFASETRATATPASAAQVAGQGDSSASTALIIGGSAIGLAALLAAVLLFMRSRRS
jgi:hypothetical protein